MKKLLLFIVIAASSVGAWAQGMGLGTATPTEILHLFRDGNTAVAPNADVAILHQSLTAGTGGPFTVGATSSVSSNLVGVGAVAWATPTNADATNNSYATATVGTSNYLYTNKAFTIPGGATVSSVSVNVEKSYTNNPVSLLDPWVVATKKNKTTHTFSYTTSAGTDRCLVFISFYSDGQNKGRQIDSVTYAGVTLTKLNNITGFSNGDDSDLEVWYLKDVDIITGIADVVVTYDGNVPDDMTHQVGVYQYVDQTNPISSSFFNTGDASGKVSSYQLGSALNVFEGDVMIFAAGIENKDKPMACDGAFVERVESIVNNNSKLTLGIYDKAISATGTEQPTATINGGGSTERWDVAGLVLNNGFGTVTDNVVSLYSGGALIGANLALGTVWTTTDATSTYAAAASLAQLNAADFGVVVSATNAGTHVTAQIDYVSVTVVYSFGAPASYTQYTSGLDISTGNYVISQGASLGAGDVMRMNTGTITFSVAAGVHSDKRYKTNITPLTGALKKLSLIDGVSYDMRVDEFPEMSFTKDRQIGFIAQDLEKVYPELVRTDAKGYKSVTYATMTPVLVQAIKELNQKINSLEKENKILSAEVKSYKSLEQEVFDMHKILNAINVELNSTNTSEK